MVKKKVAEYPTCRWVGASGTNYAYFILKLPAKFKEGQDGNYIYSKKNTEGKWVPIYIGEGDLDDRVSDNHHQATCIKQKGTTHIHVHLNAKKEERKFEERDLLFRYAKAYKPNGCNEKPGG